MLFLSESKYSVTYHGQMFAPNALICTAFKHGKRFPRNITLLAAASDQSDLTHVWLVRIPTDCHTWAKARCIHWDRYLVLGSPIFGHVGVHQMEPLLAHAAIGVTIVVHVAIFAEFIVFGLNLVIDAVFYLYAIHIFLSSFLLLALVNGREPEGPAVGIILRFLGVLAILLGLGHSMPRAGCCPDSFVAFRHLGGCSGSAGFLLLRPFS